ncbi:tetratricopeptide repeat protein [Candidatus Marinarcus aquaticus]|uniref:VWFA domain-containing protein n=1 Tax=Candidatus Marinarcus aquaticus TaxID=2044504 RepID=A0A4Q0XQI5_9BACT|nr:tetratricopeptide repeat protein [Candidatus Marinarcus aquaticus]RXJ54547.1 hypothetical protein CRV04_10955 [Candidatus Marinarcus aquaticus]
MQFLYPNVLFMMLIPTLLLIFLLNTKKSRLHSYFKPEILNALSAHSKGLNKTTRNYLFFIALILMIIALARPVMNEKEQKIEQETIPLIVAIDISKSMLAQDVFPSRLQLSIKKLETLISKATNHSIGVVLFGQNAFILSPVTNDFNSLKQMVEKLDFQQEASAGSNIQAMLEASNALLKNYQSKNIILLSDGGNKKDYSQELEYIKKQDIKLYTIAVATNDPTPIPTSNGYQTKEDGTIVLIQRNDAIKNLSLQNGAGFIQFSINDQDIHQILNEINQQSQKQAQSTKRFKTYTELFYYPLAFALLLLFVTFSSLPKLKRTALFCAFILCTFQPQSQASLLDFQTLNDAKEHYENKEYKASSKLYEKVVSNAQGYYNLGNSYYKQGKYEKAIENYNKVVTEKAELEAQKLHNLGNAYAKLGQLQEAKKVYEKALKLKNDEETQHNLDEVLKALKEQEQQNNQQNEQEQNQQDSNKNQEQKKKESKESSQNKKNNQEKTQEKNQNSEQKQEAQQKNQEQKNAQEQKEQAQQASQQQMQQAEISDLEERKWLKSLQNQNQKTLLRKFESSSDDEASSASSPW